MSTIVFLLQKNDVLCFYALNKKIHSKVLDTFMKLLTQLGSIFFAIATSLAVLLYNKNMGIILVSNLLASQLIIHTLKRIVNRPRPYKTLEWAKAINPPKCRYSLPSGHSGSALSIALVLSYFFPLIKAILLPIAVLVGVSRVYLGCHYPTDVTVGFLISILVFEVIKFWFLI